MPPKPRRKRLRSPYAPKAPARPATDRQRDFLAAVVELTAELGHAPSAADIAARLGMSRQGAEKQLHALETKGLLSDVPRMVRSGQWQLTEAGEAERGQS